MPEEQIERRKDYKALVAIELDLKLLTAEVRNMHRNKNEAHEAILERIDKLTDKVYGNGVPGLASDVLTNTNDLENHKSNLRWVIGGLYALQGIQLGILVKMLL